jgi:hypothetical protein
MIGMPGRMLGRAAGRGSHNYWERRRGGLRRNRRVEIVGPLIKAKDIRSAERDRSRVTPRKGSPLATLVL